MPRIGARQASELRIPVWMKFLITVVACMSVSLAFVGRNGLRVALDVNVYRLGAQRLLDGLPLYEGGFPIHGGISLPFTYPPVSAIMFTPLTFLGPVAVSAAMTALNLALLYGIVWMVLRRVGGLDRISASWVAAGCSSVLVFSGPVVSTLYFGQINLVLVALVLTDAFLVPRRYRGVLMGVAAAVKLTPAVFGLWLLLRKDWASAARMVCAALSVTLVAHLLMPQDSAAYWLHALADTERIGGLAYASNQSINGELWRLGLRTATEGGALWMALVLVVFAATVALMLRLLRAGQPGAALAVNALFGLLASPVSWAHHFVWVVVFLFAGGVMLWRVRREQGMASGAFHWRGLGWLIAAGAVCVALQPTSLAPSARNLELEWNVFQHVLGNAYLWWMLAAYPALWFLTDPVRRADRDQRAENGGR